MLLMEIESVKEVKSSEITWRNQIQIIMEQSYCQTETKMPLILAIEPKEEMRTGENWRDAI